MPHSLKNASLNLKTNRGMGNLIIRHAHYDELEAIARLDALVFGQNAWPFNSFVNELQLHFSKLLIAELDTTFAGFALAWYIADEIQLMRIAVNPVFQRNKIGSALIQHITHYAQNQSKIVLEVADNNTQAIAFYTSLGFYRVGVRKNYYHLNSAILMEKIIDHED